MRKIDLGQAMGILANLGVLVGILLLAYELNQNRQMMRSQTRSNISDTLVEMLAENARDRQFSDIQMKVDRGEEISDVEFRMFRTYQGALWRYRENVFYQYQQGMFDEDEYVGQRENWRPSVTSEPVDRAIWCERQDIHSPAFVAEVNSLMEVPCERP